jgi:hypothetical protein
MPTKEENMHLRPVTKKAAILEDWSAYENSWLYLMLFIIASIIFPQKL